MIVITGGSGFIGTHLCRRVAKSGSYLNIDLVPPKIETAESAYARGNIKNLHFVLGSTRGAGIIYHLAAQTSVQKSIKNPVKDFYSNAAGTLNLLEACRKNDIPMLVYASSAAIYGVPQYSPIDEAHPKAPLAPYGSTKLAGDSLCELYHKTYGIKTVRLRFFNVFGVGQDPKSQYSGVITKFAARINDNKNPAIYGDGSQTRDFVHVSDVVDAILQSAKSPAAAGKAYNIGTGVETSIKGLAQTMISLSGKKLEIDFKPALSGDIPKSIAKIDAAKADFGFAPKITLKQGLERLIDRG
ncbi:MAG: NAD-dependent epimerase/dehydratase family protein [Candidatus Micrarchaeia archaeon]